MALAVSRHRPGRNVLATVPRATLSHPHHWIQSSAGRTTGGSGSRAR